MMIFDSFLYSEPFERDVLLAKLHCESALVTGWIAVENAYSIKGHLKGHSLAALVEDDPSFAPFRERLTIVSLSRDFSGEYRHRMRDRAEVGLRGLARPNSRLGLQKEFAERPYFHAERKQREAAVPALLERSQGKGWSFVSDVDELIDASDAARRDQIIDSLRAEASIVLLPRERYVFDYDNQSLGAFRGVPAVRIQDLATQPELIGTARLDKTGLATSPFPLVFEYSYCYPAELIHRKLETFTHLDPGETLAGRALTNNHSLREPSRSVIETGHWYEKVPMQPEMHPSYILENVDRLRTGIVNPSYREARVSNYPSLFRMPDIPGT